MRSNKLVVVITIIMVFSCSKSEITTPVDDDYNLVGTTPIETSVMKKMEGIYKLTGGSADLGSQFVCKVSKTRVSFFCDKEGIFIVLKYGFKDSDGSIQFSGFWRYSEFPTHGTIHFSITAEDGATDLLAGIISNLLLNGTFSDNSISLNYDRPFSQYTIDNEFLIFGHHGVQTASNPPFAENSINAIIHGESYGLNGLEYDVRMTKDNVPICIHDAKINTRLTQKGPLSGNWDQYPFSLITEYIRLIDGQKVPSVEQALNAFIDSTTLKYFWMDIKGNPDIFRYLEPVVRNAYAKAAAQNRDVVIFAGLPSEDVIAEFNKQPTYKSVNPDYAYSSPLPTLCEISVDKSIENGCSYYGPRFTQGLLLDEINLAHNNGIKVISWTLNGRGLIYSYLKDGNFDGFITDYPAYVVYYYYTMY